jgi:hypothetical protein
VELTNS